MLPEGGVDVLHGGDEERRRVLRVDVHLIADGDGLDGGFRVVGEDVGLDPGVGEGCSGGGGGELLVGEGDGEGDAGAGKGGEDGGVGVVELDLGDTLGFEELYHRGGGGKVVGDAAVVNSDGAGVGEGGVEGENEKEEGEEMGEIHG